MLGNYAAKAIGAAFAKGGVSAIFGAGAGPLGIAAGMVVGAVYSILKSVREKAIKEAQEDFKELEQKYSKTRSLFTSAEKFEELSNGVDKMGRNVSLTEEEYQEFLELNESLAELYPELIIRVDEAGQHFIGFGD